MHLHFQINERFAILPAVFRDPFFLVFGPLNLMALSSFETSGSKHIACPPTRPETMEKSCGFEMC